MAANKNLTNPTDLVDISLLDYFKQKLEQSGATVTPSSDQTCIDIIGELI